MTNERAELSANSSGETAVAVGPHSNAIMHVLPATPVVANDSEGRLGWRNVRDLWTFRELLYFLTWRDVKVRYKQTVMGASWAIIQPLVMMLIFAVFFGLLGVPTDDMPQLLFFYCGLLPWTFFSTAVTYSSVSLVANANLITKVYFPRVLIPAATIAAGLVDLSVASVILVGLIAYYQFSLTWGILMLPLIVLITVLLALGLGVWLAALTVKYRDVRHVMPFVMQVWFFITPIIYPTSVVPEKWRWLLYLNPMTGIVAGIRSAVAGRAFDWGALSFSAAVTLVLLTCAIAAFHRIEKGFADVI
jgi:lipopolysaccharide transport system permease protein